MSQPFDDQNPYAAPMPGRPPRAKSAAPMALHGIATGLNLTLWGLVIALTSGITGLFLLFAANVLFGRMGVLAVAALIGVAVVAGALVSFIGQVLCCVNVPDETNTLEIMLGVVCCTVAYVVVAVCFGCAVAAGALPADHPIQFLASLFSLAGGVLYCLFLKRLARHLDRPDLAQTAHWVKTMIIFTTAMSALAPLAVWAIGRVAIAIVVGTVLLSISVLLRLGQLLANLRDAILCPASERSP